MRAQMIGIGASAAVIDHEPNVERLGLVRALPRFAQQARLIVGRQRRRFADVHVGGAQPQDGGDDRVDDVVRRHDEQAHRTAVPLGERDDLGQQPALVRRRRALAATSPHGRRHVEQPHGHDDDVAIAGALKRRHHVSQRMRIANGHQHVAGARLDLVERELGGGQQIEGRRARRPTSRRDAGGRRR